MNKTDKIYRATAMNDQFRVIAADTTNTCQTARDLHDLSPISTILMGRLIIAIAMMSTELKDPFSELSLRIDSDQPLRGALAIINGSGDLKGYAFEPKLFLDNQQDNFLPGKFLLPGTLSIIKSYQSRRPYSGYIELVSGDIAEDIAYYYQQSEQIPTAVNLGILIDPQARVRSAGGFMIQQMPGADLKLADVIISNLNATPNVSDLMDMGLDIPKILERFVLKDLDWRMLDTKELTYRCNCSKERFSAALRLLGRAELETMHEGISPVCHYCNATYDFSQSDIESIIESL